MIMGCMQEINRRLLPEEDHGDDGAQRTWLDSLGGGALVNILSRLSVISVSKVSTVLSKRLSDLPSPMAPEVFTSPAFMVSFDARDGNELTTPHVVCDEEGNRLPEIGGPWVHDKMLAVGNGVYWWFGLKRATRRRGTCAPLIQFSRLSRPTPRGVPDPLDNFYAVGFDPLTSDCTLVRAHLRLNFKGLINIFHFADGEWTSLSLPEAAVGMFRSVSRVSNLYDDRDNVERVWDGGYILCSSNPWPAPKGDCSA